MVYFGDVKVAGTNHEGRADLLRRLARDDGRGTWKLDPDREPENPHDCNAVAIIASRGREKMHLGYLPKQVAAIVSQYQIIGIVPRSLDPDGRYLYVDVYHSKKQLQGCAKSVTSVLVILAGFYIAVKVFT